MSQFWLYFNLGLQHILDWQAYEHVLFLAVLVAAYTGREWKKALRLVGIFTLGHLLSLVLSTFEVVLVKNELVEFLIPLSILLCAGFNIFTAGAKANSGKINLLYVASLFFGVIHGLSFSTYFKSIIGNSSEKVLPLIEFELGIVAAQFITLIIVMLLSFILQGIFRFSKRDWILVFSSIIVGLAIPMLIEHIFW